MGSIGPKFWEFRAFRVRGETAFIIELNIPNIGIHRLKKLTREYSLVKDSYSLEESQLAWASEIILRRLQKGEEDADRYEQELSHMVQ